MVGRPLDRRHAAVRVGAQHDDSKPRPRGAAGGAVAEQDEQPGGCGAGGPDGRRASAATQAQERAMSPRHGGRVARRDAHG